MTDAAQRPSIALAGATGRLGGRLLQALEAAAYPVRCLTRRPEFLAGRAGAPGRRLKESLPREAPLVAAC